MDLNDATRMILAESASYPELMRVARGAYDELAAGRDVHHSTLTYLIREAGRKDLYPVLIDKYGQAGFDEMVTVLAREIDRQSPLASH